MIRIKSTFCNYNLISCHAHTEIFSEEDKDLFYDYLDKTLDKCPKNYVKILRM